MRIGYNPPLRPLNFIFIFYFKYPPYPQTLISLICGTFNPFGCNYQPVTFTFLVGLYFD